MKKKIRLFANRSRVTRTRITYIALTAGTVAAALLLVLLNRWIFRLSERGLYDDPKYEAVNIISADSIGAPLSLETRLALFRRCERQGDERAVMPGELDESEVTERIKSIWSDLLKIHAQGNRLPTGESVESVLNKTRVICTLRDFYNDETGAKLALWFAQAYCTANDGRTFCLSVQFDSRTGEAYAISCALFGNVSDGLEKDVLGPFLAANGYAESLSEQASVRMTERGYDLSLTLPDGVTVTASYDLFEQYGIRFE